ncbi:MAG: PilZ domain-containing protein [Erythrobacter sp.]|nr:PilZ domain-containing protein [Erythrobacter sp.]
MRLFARGKPAPVPELRKVSRTRVDSLATMLMPSGDRIGRLFDISTDGARFITETPPATGVSAILDWELYEAYCKVIWVKPGMCGVQFDRPIPAKVIEDLAAAAPAGPRLVHNADGGEAGTPAAPQRFVC